MDEWGKAGEVGLIECQTCEKKIYVVKFFEIWKILTFFSLNLIIFTMFELGFINLNFFVI